MAIIIIRTFIIYFALLLSMRLMGKRQIGELEVSELVVTVLIADITSMPLQDIGIPLINGLIPLIVLLCCEVLVSGAVTRSIRFRKFLCGTPSVLVERGRIVQSEMRKNRFTLDELYEELRQQCITDISKIEYAILETNGTLNVVLYPGEMPPTCNQMGIEVPDASYPIIIINEGRVLSNNLAILGRNETWLMKELKKRGISDPEDVYLFCMDRQDRIYMAPMEVQK